MYWFKWFDYAVADEMVYLMGVDKKNENLYDSGTTNIAGTTAVKITPVENNNSCK
jgi:hypothetical protein